jgi:hypothetical protein
VKVVGRGQVFKVFLYACLGEVKVLCSASAEIARNIPWHVWL